MPWSRDQLRKSEGLHWLLDLTWAGRHYFHAEQHISADAYGEGAEDWLAGLDVGGPMRDTVDPFSDSPEPRSVNVTLHLPRGVDVPALVSRGFGLGSATGKLLLWAEGTSEAITVIDGVVRDPQYGSPDEAITFALEELPFDDRALWPPVRAVVDSTTWPTHSTKAEGEPYPWIFGAPPLDHADAFGSPALAVDVQGDPVTDFILLIAGHHVEEGGTVGVRNLKTGEGDSFTVINTTDGDGNPVATVDLKEVGTDDLTTVAGDDAYWVRWGLVTQSAGLQQAGSTLRGAGDHLVWWLTRSTLRWDRGRVLALAPRLNAFQIDACVMASPTSRISPIDWIREAILPVVPISARMGPRGLYFVWYEWDARAADALAHIDGDSVCSRMGAISYTPRDDVANEWRVRHRIDAESDKYRLTSVVTGSQSTAALESSAVTHRLCRASETLYGHRVQELSLPAVSDSNTAGLTALWKASAHAMQHRTVTYACPRDLAWLNPGDIVTVTDADVGLSSAVALVEAMPWGPLEVLPIQLRLLDQGEEWAT